MSNFLRNFLTRFSALVSLFLAIAMIFGFYGYTNGLKADSVFRLQTKSGDLSALQGIVIKGDLQDLSHSLRFEIKDGSVNRRFLAFDSPRGDQFSVLSRSLWPEKQYTSSLFYQPAELGEQESRTELNTYDNPSDSRYTTVEETIVTTTKVAEVYINIDFRERYSSYWHITQKSGLRAEPPEDFVFESKKSYSFLKEDKEKQADYRQGALSYSRSYYGDFEQVNKNQYALNSEYCLAEIGDELYFTYPTGQGFSGTNGIYRVDRFDPWYLDSKIKGSVSLIVAFEITEETQVLGLHRLADSLLLVTREEGIFTLRLYQKDGVLLSTLTVPSFMIKDERYISFSSENSISFLSSAKGGFEGSSSETTGADSLTNGNDLRLSMLSVSLSPELVLSNFVDLYSPDYTNKNIRIHNMATVNDKLIVIAEAFDVRLGGNAAVYPLSSQYELIDFTLQSKDFILIFGKTKNKDSLEAISESDTLLYWGELESDKKEDLWVWNSRKVNEGYRHFRSLANVQIEGGAGLNE